MKTATAKGSHNQSAINPFEVCRAKCNRVCGKYGRGNQCCKSKNRQVAHKTWQQNWHMRWKISCTKSGRRRGRGSTGKRGVANMPAGTTNKEEGPASNTCVPVYVHTCVCVCSVIPAKVDTFCNVKRKLAAVAVGVGFFMGFAWSAHTHTHTETEVHRGTQSHRQWKGALAQAVANWLHCRIERVLIANDLHLAETLKVLPIEDLLDKPKQTRTKLPPKRMDWWDPLFLFLSLFLSKKWMCSSTSWLCHKLSTFSISRSVNQLIFEQRTVNW